MGKIGNGHKKFKKDPNNVNLSHGVILCDIVARKKYQTLYIHYVSKNLHKMTYHVRGFMAFGPRDGCYVLNRDIVYDTVPILCMHVYIGMENNVAGGSFPFRRSEKPVSIFQAQKDGLFCEAATKM